MNIARPKYPPSAGFFMSEINGTYGFLAQFNVSVLVVGSKQYMGKSDRRALYQEEVEFGELRNSDNAQNIA
jgi:hypothetical protein